MTTDSTDYEGAGFDLSRDLWDGWFRGRDGSELTDPGVVRLLAHAAGFRAVALPGGGFHVQPIDPARDGGITQVCLYGGEDLEVEVPNMGTLVIPGFL